MAVTQTQHAAAVAATARPRGESPGWRGTLAYRPDIEGLRGLAVLLVVAYHSSVPGMGGGFVGVDVFFVLSGYLITSLIDKEITATGRLGLTRFYARRIRRLLPAAAAVVLFTLVAGILLHPPHVQAGLSKTAVAAGAYVSNIWLERQAGDYFGPGAESDPLLHMWSLSVEEQFYLLWPVLLLAGLRGRLPRQRLGLLVVAVVVFSFAGSWWFSIVSEPTAFYSSPLRAWEFAAGGLLSLTPSGTRPGRLPVRILGFCGLAAVVGSAVLLSPANRFPGTSALPVVCGTLLILLVGHVHGSGFRVLQGRIMQRLGTLSYSWYLWHWPVLVFLAVVIPDPGWTAKAAAAVAALLPAALAYRYIEGPVRHSHWLGATSARTIVFGLVVTAGVVVAGLAAMAASDRVARSAEYRAIRNSVERGPIEQDGCVATFRQTTLQECSYGGLAGPLIVLMGDSHASQWGAGLIAAVASRGNRLLVLTKSSCPTADVPVTEPNLGRRYIECERWRDRALARVTGLRPDLVLVANSQGYLRNGLLLAAGEPYDAWAKGLHEVLDQLSRSAGRVVLIQDTPWMGDDVPTCLAMAIRPLGRARRCDAGRSTAVDARLAAVNLAVASGFPNVQVADFTDRLCSDSTCPAIVDGWIAYRDANHISPAMAASLAPDLGVRLDGEPGSQGGMPDAR